MKNMLNRWLSSPVVTDPVVREELLSIAGNEEEIASRFCAPLNFGTGGIRGLIGAGINRMNVYVVRQATQGIADLIRAEGEDACKRGVVVGHDCRNYSSVFAWETCRVLVANGIKAYLFDELRPTPEVSFAIRKLNCIAGINITASHNPKEYNGYKAYWEDGAQLSLEQADTVFASICAADIFDDVKVAEEAEARAAVQMLDRSFDESFIAEVLNCTVNADVIRRQKDMTIVYTPLHGTGYRLVPEVLTRAGFGNVVCVPEQMVLSGDFPTVKSPNPENKDAFTDAIRLADSLGADFIIGTDPDADRAGVVVRDATGEFVAMTGNQIGALLIDYVLRARRDTDTLPENAAAVKSIVSTEMATAICEKYGVTMFNVLTGFKFIGEKIKEFEADNSHTYVFGFEESYGYLTGTYARDKDAVAASLLIAEMAAYYRDRGQSLAEAMDALYAEYGYHYETTLSLTVKGADGPARMKAMMTEIRAKAPESLGGIALEKVYDLAEGAMNLPKSDVLYYRLADGSVFVVRPSGTEPKVKFYIMVKGETRPIAVEKADRIGRDFYTFAGIEA